MHISPTWRIWTFGMKVLTGDLINKTKGDMVEENGEKRSVLHLVLCWSTPVLTVNTKDGGHVDW